jgi:hypothetical protein
MPPLRVEGGESHYQKQIWKALTAASRLVVALQIGEPQLGSAAPYGLSGLSTITLLACSVVDVARCRFETALL